MIELQILKLFLLKREIFTTYFQYLDFSFLKANHSVIYKLYQVISQYYLKYPDSVSVSYEDLESLYLINYPINRDTQRQELDAVLAQLRAVDSNEALVAELLNNHRIRAVAQEAAVIALDVAEGRLEPSVLVDKIQSLSDMRDVADETAFVSDNLEELYSAAVKTPGLRWRQDFLNKSLGSLRKGDFGFIFARPETGKTTFLASEITFMASQELNGPVLWFNNEEQGSKVMLRCYQAALGCTLAELFSDREESQRKYEGICGGNIRIFDDASISKDKVESLCKELSPSLIIFDQIDKIAGFTSDRRDLEMGKIYRWARELAKEYAPVIGVCQADASGEGVRFLTMANVADAKTAKQAEADWVLGIGKTHDEGFNDIRFFQISKNKLIGDDDTLPEMRHSSGSLIIQPQIARYKDPNRVR